MPHVVANINVFFIIFKTNLQKHILPGLPVIWPHTMSWTVSIIMKLPPPLVGGIETNLRKRVLAGFPATYKELDCWSCLHTQKSYFDTHKELGLTPYTL